MSQPDYKKIRRNFLQALRRRGMSEAAEKLKRGELQILEAVFVDDGKEIIRIFLGFLPADQTGKSASAPLRSVGKPPVSGAAPAAGKLPAHSSCKGTLKNKWSEVVYGWEKPRHHTDRLPVFPSNLSAQSLGSSADSKTVRSNHNSKPEAA